jgi:hypothetical protein
MWKVFLQEAQGSEEPLEKLQVAKKFATVRVITALAR